MPRSLFCEAFAINWLRGPVGIRTPNLLIRSQMLYPIELRNLSFCTYGYALGRERGKWTANIAICAYLKSVNQKNELFLFSMC